MIFNNLKTDFGQQPGFGNSFSGASNGLPKPPPSAMGGVPLPAQDPQLTQQPSKPPPAVSTDPFSKDNRRQTLLQIGQAFLGSQDFFQGLGNAAGAVSGRIDTLKGQAQQLQKRNITYGGPDDQFEIETMPDGTRSVRMVPEFNQAIRDKQIASKAALSPRDAIDLRSRAIHAIQQLPESQRAGAYADLMSHPESYGLDTTGMPTAYSPAYGSIMGSMGMTVPQAEAGSDRDRAFGHKVEMDSQKAAQARLKAIRPPTTGRPRSGGARRAAPNYGADLDY